MGKKSKTKIKYVFASNLPNNKVEDTTPAEVPQEETPAEESDKSAEEESTVNEEPEKESAPAEASEDPTRINYPPLVYPKGTPDNGILLCIILSLITLVSLGFLIWHERSWRTEEELNTDVQVEDTYTTLTTIVKTYVATISDPKKAEYCLQLKGVYLEASKSTDDITKIESTIVSKSRAILSFDKRNKPEEEIAYEYEWQRLFGSTGVINTYLSASNIVITKENQSDIFTAIARGLQ